MSKRKVTPPLDDEGMENKLISLAMRQAEQQLTDKTASSQVMTHFLRLGSARARIEEEQLKLQNLLLEEKIRSEQSGQQIEAMFEELKEALQGYTYTPPGEDDVDIY